MIKFFTSCGQKILQAFHCFEEYFPGKQLCSNYLQTLKLRASNFIETNFNSSGSKNRGSFNQFWLVFSENHLMNIWRICFRYDDTMIVKRTNRQSKNNNNLQLVLETCSKSGNKYTHIVTTNANSPHPLFCHMWLLSMSGKHFLKWTALLSYQKKLARTNVKVKIQEVNVKEKERWN